MFDVGFAEIFLLAVIGLLVLGPERLPGVARTLGGFVRKARTSWVSLRRTIESELAEADLSKPINKTKEEFKQIGRDLTAVPGFNSESQKSDTDSPVSESTGTPKPGLPGEPESGKPEDA